VWSSHHEGALADRPVTINPSERVVSFKGHATACHAHFTNRLTDVASIGHQWGRWTFADGSVSEFRASQLLAAARPGPLDPLPSIAPSPTGFASSRCVELHEIAKGSLQLRLDVDQVGEPR
jgi:hypothetical protein